MPAERLSMRKVRDVLRLKHTLGMSYRQISEATGVGKTVVGEYVRRAGGIGITWPPSNEGHFVVDALLDADHHALAVDVVYLARHHFGSPKARALGDAPRRLVFEPRPG